ncbi:pilus assembly FimT family protein [Hydrocarboniphaga sp.]|uniref:pilus assembly FimT family protein n=1 Tax=Hydrocarboniphaga sp. TaxID=2033016 RepID=UPI003D10544B
MRARRRDLQQGLSMIELMISLAISGLLMVSAGNLTQSWIASTRVNSALAVMTQGVSRARAIALRNPGGVANGASAAILCVSDGTVRLFSATRSPQAAATCQSSGGLWSAPLDSSASVQVNGTALSCLAFSNRGTAINPAAASGSDTCPVSSTLLISSASQNATVTLN